MGDEQLTSMVQESDGSKGEADGEWRSPWDNRLLRENCLFPEGTESINAGDREKLTFIVQESDGGGRETEGEQISP